MEFSREFSRVESARLVIEHATPEDIPALMALEEAEENAPYIFHNTAEEHAEELSDPDVWTLMIRAKEDLRVVGYIIVDISSDSEWFEFKRAVISEKGKGFGREMIDALTAYCFEGCGANKVWIECMGDNPVGLHLYPSCGYLCDGVLRMQYRDMRRPERGIVDIHEFSLLRADYEALKKSRDRG